MKLTPGDVFKIPTYKGYGFLQFVAFDDLGIACVRVLAECSTNGSLKQEEVNLQERWFTGFPLRAAIRRKIVEKAGSFDLPPNYVPPEFARSEYRVRGNFLGWHIIHRKTLQRELRDQLSTEELLLPPHGVMNDTLIVEKLESNWKLEEWK